MSSFIAWVALGVLAGASEEAKPETKPVEVAAFFHDGTVIHRAVIRDDVEIQTRYGKLAVPVSDVRRIEFGHRLSEEVSAKVEAAIKRLGSDQFPQREAAGKELVALGKQAYPALLTAAQSTDKEVSRRATEALQKIREATPEEQLQFRSEDVIHTPDCVLTGRILSPALKAQTQKFGELSFKLADLKGVYSMATRSAEVNVEAAPFQGNPQKWLDSGVTLEVGMNTVITATGKIDMVPMQNGQYVTGPEGGAHIGQHTGFLVGTLLGRIGEKGDIFIIGKRYEGKISQAGKLYVFVVPVPGGNNVPAGSFKVKATSGFGLSVNPAKNTPVQPLPAGFSFDGPGRSTGVPVPFNPPPMVADGPPAPPARVN